jgi:serine/threonine protein kinase
MCHHAKSTKAMQDKSDQERSHQEPGSVDSWISNNGGVYLSSSSFRHTCDSKRFDRVVKLGIEIASTLEHAHREGIVHCDIKPGNVIVTPKHQVKLLDFGLARLLRIGDADATRSLAEITGGGTLPYMAPEQLLHTACDFRVDVYAVGVLLYELVTGRQPFQNPISAALIDEILHRVPDPPEKWKPGLSPNLQYVITPCLQKDPQRRYQTAGELSAALVAVQSSETLQLPEIQVLSGVATLRSPSASIGENGAQSGSGADKNRTRFAALNSASRVLQLRPFQL